MFHIFSVFSAAKIEGCQEYTDVATFGESGREVEILDNSSLCLKGSFLSFGENISITSAFFIGTRYQTSSTKENAIGVVSKNVIFNGIEKSGISKLTVKRAQIVLIVPIRPSASYQTVNEKGRTHFTYENRFISTMKSGSFVFTSKSDETKYETQIASVKFINTNAQKFTASFTKGSKLSIIADGASSEVSESNSIPEAKVLDASFVIPEEATFNFNANITFSAEKLDKRIPEFAIKVSESNKIITMSDFETRHSDTSETIADFGKFVGICLFCVAAVIFIILGVHKLLGTSEADEHYAPNVADLNEDDNNDIGI